MILTDKYGAAGSVAALLRLVNEHVDPATPALTFYKGGERGPHFTFGDYASAISGWSQVLSGLGLRKGDRMATLLNNRPEVPILYLAALQIGVVVVPLNPRYSHSEMIFVLEDAKPSLVVTDAPTGGAHAHYLPQLCKLYDLDEMAVRPSSALPDAEVEANSPALILYTSGTTAFPKGVVQTHANLVANATSMLRELPMDDLVQCSVMPFYHSHAVGFGMMTPLLSGAHMVMTQRMDPLSWSTVVGREHVTVTSMVPSMLQLLVRLRVTAADLPALRFILVSAAPLPSALAERFESQSGIKLAHAWGLSEFTNFATALSPDVPETLRQSLMFARDVPCVGRSLPGAEVEVVSRDGDQVAPLELGELRVKGPSMTLGYNNNSAATDAAMRSGWLYSGDEGYYVEEDGVRYFFITDRIKDIIIRSGDKISPAAVETHILSHLPELAGQLIALGFPDETYGEEIGLVVETDDPMSLEQVAAVIGDMPVRTRPKVILWGHEVIPRTHTGKAQRRLLVEHFHQFRRRTQALVVAKISDQ